MKTAKKSVACVFIDCPECGETQASQTGSLYWTTDEVERAGKVRECFDCQKPFKMPKV